jgi:K(+)-stimulated pyrophosphate-energized sodium pump
VLGGFLAGATVSGVLMGMFQNNAGGAWDNAKKSFEKGVEINGEIFYKKSEPHKASVTGDTVGDPFKDTSGPSMNILIKLMSIVSLVVAPTLAKIHAGKIERNRQEKIASLQAQMTGYRITDDGQQVVGPGTSTDLVAPEAISTNTAAGSLNEAGDYVYNVGTLGMIKLADGTEIEAGANSTEAKLINFIQDGSRAVDKETWFPIDRLYFESGKATVKESSMKQIQNIASILKAYPDVAIKLGGYTDNTGDSAKNQALSAQRADAALAEFLKLNVPANRLAAEGYGPQHPICAANDTKECQAQNRRIDIRVTKK